MAIKKILLSIFIYLLVTVAVADRRFEQSRHQQRKCQLQRLTASQPSQRIESEGGITEIWDENEDQFQCAGVAPIRNILQPNALSLPNFHPSPRLVYIEQGSGFMGLNFPGCPETFHSQSGSFRPGRQEEEEQYQGRGQGGRRGGQQSGRDQHQKVQRIRKGDIIAVPAGVTHWCFNDGREELVALAIHDLNNQANQLDSTLRSFYLAGSVPRQGRQQQGGQRGRGGEKSQETFQNIFRAFDEGLLAEAYNVPREIINKMQREDERGLIIKVRDSLQVIKPDEGEEEEEYEHRRGNGLEETCCSTKIKQNIHQRGEAEVYSRQAGRINVVNQHRLPILRYLDMSAEKGTLFPNAIYSPHWSMNSHSIVYVTRGEAKMHIVGHNGETIFDDRVNQGDMFVIPQFFASTARAGQNGFEWVSIKTSSQPIKNPLVGYTSVLRAMPNQVLTNAYRISPSDARQLKENRGGQTFLLSPYRSSY